MCMNETVESKLKYELLLVCMINVIFHMYINVLYEPIYILALMGKSLV